jgi:hypothetical protein
VSSNLATTAHDVASSPRAPKLVARVRNACDVSESDALEMFRLYDAYYEGTQFALFSHDLAGKTHVIELRSKGILRGFSTVQVIEFELGGTRNRAIFSGDTIIDSAFWGEQALVDAFCGLAGQLSARQPQCPLYWFLICKGYRTFRYLSVFAREFYPNPETDTPESIRRRLDCLARGKFGDAYDPVTGLIRFPQSRGRLRTRWAEIRGHLLEQRIVRFFLERNPGYRAGDELACLAELSERNLRSFAKRAFIAGRNGRAAPAPNAWRGAARRFGELLDRPRVTQELVLADVLSRNARCEYGRRYDFASIASSSEFRRRLPIVTADDLQPGIERMVAGEGNVLLSDDVAAFEPTGGSSDGERLVPYTEASLEAFRRALLPWLDDVYNAHPGLEDTTTYWSVSPACRDRRETAGGTPIGLSSDAAYFGKALARDLAEKFSVPPMVGSLHDIDTWRRVTATYLLADDKLGLISVWSPTFLLELLRYARDNGKALARDLAAGSPRVATAALALQLPVIRPNAERARRVAEILASPCHPYTALWPRLELISCWDQAASRGDAAELREQFPGVRVQGKGLVATEGIVSIPYADAAFPVLALESGFFEFLDGHGDSWLADEVIEGEEYELLMTNHSGLYRYAIGDRVRIGGFADTTPLIEFVGRSGVVSDMCGEKLADSFVSNVLRPMGMRFAALAPNGSSPRGYVLVLDAAETSLRQAHELAAEVDSALHANPQYAYARRLGQLAPLRPARCDAPLSSWLQATLARGQKLGDFKPSALYGRADWDRAFHEVT